jgi:hypothetical protein
LYNTVPSSLELDMIDKIYKNPKKSAVNNYTANI